jgi:hypothetical protein
MGSTKSTGTAPIPPGGLYQWVQCGGGLPQQEASDFLGMHHGTLLDLERSFAMSGAHRLSLEWNRQPSFPSLRWQSELNFGVIALALLATLAVVVTLMFPEIQLQPVDLFVGP